MGNENQHFISINAPCDAQCCYKFTLGSGAMVGHLLGLSFTNAGKDFKVDRKLCNPESPDELVPVMGVCNFIGWTGGPSDPIEAEIRTSEENVQILQEALSSLTGGAEVDADFAVYKYSYKDKKYFKYFHTDGKKIKFVITKGTTVNISPKPNMDIQQPLNYTFTISLTPKSEGDEQEFHLAYAASSPFTRRVGAAEAA